MTASAVVLPPKEFYAVDGRMFAQRVRVYSRKGHHLYRTNAEKAHQMCLSGAAAMVDSSGNRVERIVALVSAPPAPKTFFVSKVQVWSDAGRYLFHCHPEQARRLVLDGSAFSADVQANGRIWKLILTSDLSYLSAKPPSPLSLANYQGQRYIYRTKVRCPVGGYTNTICSFKKVDKRDRWAFILSQTDVMAVK